MDAVKVGEKIKQHRREKNLTQRELGEMLGITDMAVSYWEQGRQLPSDSLKVKLSKILEVGIMELFYEDA